MKNRFLLLGFTGPVGSGCTNSARFLAGYPVYGRRITKLLQDQTNEERLKRLNKRITSRYKTISELKEKISRRKAKKLGTYWKALIDDQDDPFIRGLERDLSIKHTQLKIYLRKREVFEVLKEMINQESLIYINVNENDKELFGFEPFIYLSFTDIIAKLAIEAFKEEPGKDLFESYFADKISRAREEAKSDLIVLKNSFYASFDIASEKWDEFAASNKFITSRAYQIYLSGQEFFDSARFIKKSRQVIDSYYELLRHIKSILKKARSGDLAKNQMEYHFALSEIMQDWGDNIRATGNPFTSKSSHEPIQIEQIYKLAEELNVLIKFLRFRVRFMDDQYKLISADEKIGSSPALFAIECFRNPFEVDYFRSRYSEFYLLSFYAQQEIRKERMKYFSAQRDERDRGVDKKPGQVNKLDVTSCVLLSDIAILNNAGTNEQDEKLFFDFFEKLMRYIAIIRRPGCIPPEMDELYMHLAYSTSLMSTCISRKVGAIVAGPRGYIYGAGWNDVSEGQIGCGLRRVDDYKDIEFFPELDPELSQRFDDLITKNGKYLCYKDAFSKLDVENELERIKREGSLSTEGFSQLKEQFKIKRLEYCRALHAEENAILQTAKVGGMPISGGSIYTTTFPCELCAKKIYQTGIKTIYFTEPYLRSTSKVLLGDGNKRIEIRPFEGVKSHSFYKLFKPVFDKKDYEAVERSKQ